TSEIMIGMLEYARRSGIVDIITVIDPIMNRVMKRSANAPYDYVGKVAENGNAKVIHGSGVIISLRAM
ncbi:MAG: acyl-homoserine-lactone synthase, partial [Paracoccaceae bacterium]